MQIVITLTIFSQIIQTQIADSPWKILSSNFAAKVDKLKKLVGSTSEVIANKTRSTMESIGNNTKSFMESASSNLAEKSKKAKEHLTDLVKKVKTTKDFVVEKGKKTYDYASNLTSTVADEIASKVRKTTDFVAEKGKKTYDYASNLTSTVTGDIASKVKKTTDFVAEKAKKNYDYASNLTSTFTETIASKAKNSADVLLEYKEDLIKFLTELSKKIEQSENNFNSTNENTIFVIDDGLSSDENDNFMKGSLKKRLFEHFNSPKSNTEIQTDFFLNYSEQPGFLDDTLPVSNLNSEKSSSDDFSFQEKIKLNYKNFEESFNEHQNKTLCGNSKNSNWKKYLWAAFVGSPLLLKTIMSSFGFASGGIGVSSLAAHWQSIIGNVLKKSSFSMLQKIGMIFTVKTAVVFSAVILVGSVAFYIYCDYNQCFSEKTCI